MQKIDVDQIKKDYPPGTRIKLNFMDDPYAPVEAGTCGTVRLVDDQGQLHMAWDNGRSLAAVPGLLSHDEGRTFATILHTLSELGYDVAWQVLNSANFGVPQSRKRVYIVGYLRDRCAGEVLAYRETNPKTLVPKNNGGQGERIYI